MSSDSWLGLKANQMSGDARFVGLDERSWWTYAKELIAIQLTERSLSIEQQWRFQ